MNGVQIEFGFECKVIEFGIAFEQFEFDVTRGSTRFISWIQAT
jgi:hypothetical protein